MPRGLHIHDALVRTGDPDRPTARSVTVIDGAVRDLDGPRPAPGDDLRIIDAAGRAVIPGLIDAHLHLVLGGEQLAQLDLSGVSGRREFEAAIAREHARLAPDRWLIAAGWSNERWADPRLPDKTWLAAAGSRPVVCHRMDIHAALVNDAVLERCDTSADPPGGRIGRFASGEPDGMMIETAAWTLVNPVIPAAPAAARIDALRAAQRHAHRMGLTAVGSMEYAETLRDVYLPIRDELTLRCRITLLDRGWPMSFDVGRDFAGDDRLAVIGYKSFIDGTLGSRTARMLAPYADDPAQRGLLVEIAERGDQVAWARGVAAAGLSPSMHAIGDAAARLALDAVEAVDPAVRPRIEHAQQVDERDIGRFAGVIASMQPLHKADDAGYVEARLGADRLAGTFAFRRLADAGARLAFGSDWPVVSCDPLAGVRVAVTGRTAAGEPFLPEQNLAVTEALDAYTVGAAHALGLDAAGVLAPGRLGDLVVLDRDPLGADWMHDPPRVSMTIVGGRVVYDASEDGGADPDGFKADPRR